MASLGRRLPLPCPVVRGQHDEVVRVWSVRVRVTPVLMLVSLCGVLFGGGLIWGGVTSNPVRHVLFVFTPIILPPPEGAMRRFSHVGGPEAWLLSPGDLATRV